MPTQSVQQMADHVSELLEDRLKIRGGTLADKLRRGGRVLPLRVRRAAAELALAADQSHYPKLAMRVDHDRVRRAYRRCLHHLRPIGAGQRRMGYLVTLAARSGAAVLAALAIVIGMLVWRGLV